MQENKLDKNKERRGKDRIVEREERDHYDAMTGDLYAPKNVTAI